MLYLEYTIFILQYLECSIYTNIDMQYLDCSRYKLAGICRMTALTVDKPPSVFQHPSLTPPLPLPHPDIEGDSVGHRATRCFRLSPCHCGVSRQISSPSLTRLLLLLPTREVSQFSYVTNWVVVVSFLFCFVCFCVGVWVFVYFILFFYFLFIFIFFLVLKSCETQTAPSCHLQCTPSKTDVQGNVYISSALSLSLCPSISLLSILSFSPLLQSVIHHFRVITGNQVPV